MQEVAEVGGAWTARVAAAAADSGLPSFTLMDAASVAEPDLSSSASRIAPRNFVVMLMRSLSDAGVFERLLRGTRCGGRTSNLLPGQ